MDEQTKGWERRIVLVTGASSGLGARFAARLAATGAKVVLTGRRTRELDRQVSRIRDDGGTAASVVMDTTDEISVKAAFDEAERAFGVVDTIVANAGIAWSGRSTAMPLDAWDRIIDTNLRGTFLAAREGARRLIANALPNLRSGRIVLIGSITANAPEAGLAAYVAAKAGVAQMAKVMALEWVRQGININVLSPGYVRTEMNSDWFESDAGQIQIAGFNRRRLMPASSLDAALLLLCSDAAEGITGIELMVDDGQTL